MSPLFVLPAAGASSRMRGRDKLTETVFGVPLLRRQALAALATGCPVAVMLPPGPGARREALDGLAVHIEDVPDAAEGMAASLRRGAALLAQDQPLGLLLPDAPDIEAPDINAVLAAFREAGETVAVRASDPEGRPGTPLFLPYRIARRMLELSGDGGGRGLLEGEEVRLVDLGDDRATRDLDTPEAWEAWRRARRIPD